MDKKKAGGNVPDKNDGKGGLKEKLEITRHKLESISIDIAHKNEELAKVKAEIEELSRLFPGK